MHIKGFILEDEQGREFVLMCQQPPGQSGKTFVLRGWQRLRLVPLTYSERELRRIVAGVLNALNDLVTSLPRFVENIDVTSAPEMNSSPVPARTASIFRKASGDPDLSGQRK